MRLTRVVTEWSIWIDMSLSTTIQVENRRHFFFGAFGEVLAPKLTRCHTERLQSGNSQHGIWWEFQLKKCLKMPPRFPLVVFPLVGMNCLMRCCQCQWVLAWLHLNAQLRCCQCQWVPEFWSFGEVLAEDLTRCHAEITRNPDLWHFRVASGEIAS